MSESYSQYVASIPEPLRRAHLGTSTDPDVMGLDLQEVVSRLRSVELAHGESVLASKRKPFEEMADEAIISAFFGCLAQPHKRGGLSKLIRREFKLPADNTDNFTIVEAHLNVTAVDLTLHNALVILGFEPDDFHQLSPIEYSRNFSLEYRIPGSSELNHHDFLPHVTDTARAGLGLVQENESLEAFVEVEHYGSSYVTKFEVPEPRPGIVEGFPLAPGLLKAVTVPCTVREAASSGVAFDVEKIADVHVKMGTESRAKELPYVTAPDYLLVRKMLVAAGFYEIISESGNAIYTAQLTDGNLAMSLYRKLRSFGERFGGFLDICTESCTGMWRTERIKNGELTRAAVSPVLVLGQGLSLGN